MERRAHLFTSFLDEGGADALALVRRAYGEIGEIADISKIAERARDAD